MELLAKFSIKSRLISLLMIVLVMNLVLALVMGQRLERVNDVFTEYNDSGVQGQMLIIMINRDMNYVSRLTRAIMLGDDYAKQMDKLEQRIADIYGHFEQLHASTAAIADAGQRRLMQERIASALADTRAFLEDGRMRMRELGQVARTADVRQAAYAAYRQAASPLANTARSSFRELVALKEQERDALFQASDSLIQDSGRFMYAVSASGIGVVLILVLAILGSIMRPLQHMRRSIEKIQHDADLGLRIDLKSGDELGRISTSFDAMLDKFQRIIHRLAADAEQLATASRQLTDKSLEDEESLDRQLQETGRVTASIRQMDSALQEVENATRHANESAAAADAEAGKGRGVVEATVTSIQHLAEELEGVAAVVDTLNRETAEIGTVLDVIRGVAEQTNLLALNAAIEAARAGEQGRGFAVVADEVRSLASRTQESTQEIHDMIERLQVGSQRAVRVIQGSLVDVHGSVEKAGQADHSLQAIDVAVKRIVEVNGGIAGATTAQRQVMNEVEQNMQRMQEIAEQSAQSARRTLDSSEELNELSAQLRGVVGEFRV